MDADRSGGAPDRDYTLSNLRTQVLSRLSDPTIVRPVEDTDNGTNQNQLYIRLSREEASSLSPIPWRCCPADGDGVKPSSRKRRQDHVPNYSYLDLRLSQNMSWANSRLRSGVAHAKRAQMWQDESLSTEASTREWKRAEKCYTDGLDLVPHHPELLVAYGALCSNLRRDEEAVEILRKAVDVTKCEPANTDKDEGSDIYMSNSEDEGGDSSLDKAKEPKSSTGENARRYLAEVVRRMTANSKNMSSAAAAGPSSAPSFASDNAPTALQQPPHPAIKSKGGEARVEQALRDALAERAFLSGGPIKIGNDERRGGCSKYELIDESPSKGEEYAKTQSDDREDYYRERRRKHKRRRHSGSDRKRSKKHKRKRHNYSSDSDRSEYSSDDNILRRKKNTKTKKRKLEKEERTEEYKRRRRKDSSCDDISLPSCFTSSSRSSSSNGSGESDSSTSSYAQRKRRREKRDGDRKKEKKRRRHDDKKHTSKMSSSRRRKKKTRKHR